MFGLFGFFFFHLNNFHVHACIYCSFTHVPCFVSGSLRFQGEQVFGTLPKERLCLADKLLNWPSLGHLPDPLSHSLCSQASYKQLSLPGHPTCLLNQQGTRAGCKASSGQQTPDGHCDCCESTWAVFGLTGCVCMCGARFSTDK